MIVSARSNVSGFKAHPAAFLQPCCQDLYTAAMLPQVSQTIKSQHKSVQVVHGTPCCSNMPSCH
jgi:hypothetical protein